MNFLDYPKVHEVCSLPGLCGDVQDHCRDYRHFLVSGSRVTECHEETHGVNNEVRNAVSTGPTTRRQLPPPTYAGDFAALTTGRFVDVTEARVNGFYVGLDRAIRIPEPSVRKSAAAYHIPKAFRGFRFGLYVTGSPDWDDRILYLLDEAVAYLNGARAAVELKEAGLYDEGSRVVDGAVEFLPYILAVCMAALKVGPLDSLLKQFTAWLLGETEKNYADLQKHFPPFAEQDRTWERLTAGTEGQEFRAFAKGVIGFEFGGPKPVPDDVIDWNFGRKRMVK